MRLPGSIVPAFGAPLTGALFCFPGQDLKGAANKKNSTCHPIYVLFAGAKEYFFHNEPSLFGNPETRQHPCLQEFEFDPLIVQILSANNK
jgi:hypothetical protein